MEIPPAVRRAAGPGRSGRAPAAAWCSARNKIKSRIITAWLTDSRGNISLSTVVAKPVADLGFFSFLLDLGWLDYRLPTMWDCCGVSVRCCCWVFIRPAVMFLTISEEEDLYKRQDKIIPLKWKKHILLNQFPSKALPFQLFSTDSTMAIESGYIISFPPKFYRFSFSQPVQPWPRPWLPYPHIRLCSYLLNIKLWYFCTSLSVENSRILIWI